MPYKQFYKTLIHNIGYSFFSTALMSILIFVGNVLVARFLGPGEFGTFFTISAMVMLLGVVFTGDSANTKIVSESEVGQMGYTAALKVIALYQIIFGLLAIGLIAGLRRYFPPEISIYTTSITIITVSYLTSIMFSTYWIGSHKLNWEIFASVVPVLLQSVVLVVLLPIGFGLSKVLYYWAWSWALYCWIFLPIVFLCFARRYNVRGMTITSSWFSFPHKYYLVYGFYLKASKVIQISIPLIFSFYLIYLLKGTNEIGMYGSATKIVGVISVVMGAFLKVLLPSFSRLFAQGDTAMLQSLSITFFKYINIMAFFIASVLLIFNDVIVRTVYGEVYSAAMPIFIILSAAAYFEGLKAISSSLLNATQYAFNVTVIEFVKWLFIVVSAYIAIRHYGAIGGSVILLLGSMFTVLSQLFLVKKLIKIDTLSLFFTIIIMLLAFILVSFPITKLYGILALLITFFYIAGSIKPSEVKYVFAVLLKLT